MTKSYPNSIIRFMYGNSYDNLAKQLDVTRQTIYNYVHGLRKPTPEHKKALLDALKVYHGDFLIEEEVFDTPCEITPQTTTTARKNKLDRILKDVLRKAELYVKKGMDEDFWLDVMAELKYTQKG